ncbi:hypothetical protein [Burkholderia contaminans]|uniref:hypothetical protein n=1 Tax=Burkholderia contaminans TaxID=488447 RepID=UPI00163A48DD|nr:hypothetical protein [Burkholderia contaminans]
MKSRRFGKTIDRFQSAFHDRFILMCIAARLFPIIRSFSPGNRKIESGRLNSSGFVATIGCAVHCPAAAGPHRTRLFRARAIRHSAFGIRHSAFAGAFQSAAARAGFHGLRGLLARANAAPVFRTFTGEFA